MTELFRPERLQPENDQYVLVRRGLRRQEKRFSTRMIALADVDDTTYSRRKSEANSSAYTNTLRERHIPDGRVTGRHFHEILEYINLGKITGVPSVMSLRNGTMIYTAMPEAYSKWKNGIPVEESDFVEDRQYTKQLEALGFDKRAILTTRDNFARDLRQRINGVWLENQIADRRENLETWGMISDKNQVIFDIEVPSDKDQEQAQQEILKTANTLYGNLSIVLMDVGVAQQSGMQGVAYGLFLLPLGVGKHTANEHIIKATGTTSVCIIGDSLNDETMLSETYSVPSYKGIVGGANTILSKRLGADIHPFELWHETPHGLLYIENKDLIGPQSAVKIIISAHGMEAHNAQKK